MSTYVLSQDLVPGKKLWGVVRVSLLEAAGLNVCFLRII